MNNLIKILLALSIPVAVWQLSKKKEFKKETVKNDYNLFI
jgi:hypothetical protein